MYTQIQIDNTQIGNTKDLDIAMTMYLIEYNDNYSKTSGRS